MSTTDDNNIYTCQWYKCNREFTGRKRKYCNRACANAYSKQTPKGKACNARYNKSSINRRLTIALHRRMYKSMNGKLSKSLMKYLGCTIAEFKLHLESQFTIGMTWNNYGHSKECWNIDHIKPLCKFDLTNENDLAIACHYSNMRPLWSTMNYSLGGKTRRTN